MIQKYSRYRVLTVFFREPRKVFHIREISRLVKLSQSSVTLHLKELAKENIILKTLEGLYGGYKANRENDMFRLLKLQNTSFILHESGCITFLAEKIMPQSIILFGSAAKGEDTEESDIDLFIEGKEMYVNMEKFEKAINRKISLFFKEDFKELSKELKNNIVNGIKLYGFLRAY